MGYVCVCVFIRGVHIVYVLPQYDFKENGEI